MAVRRTPDLSLRIDDGGQAAGAKHPDLVVGEGE
jgi:hypothetical protein